MEESLILKKILYRITMDPMRNLLKEYKIPFSGCTKDDLENRIIQFVDNVNSGKNIPRNIFAEFLAEQIIYGKSNSHYIMKFDIPTKRKLIDDDYIRRSLLTAKLPADDINDVLTKGINKYFELIYERWEREEGITTKVIFVFTKEIEVESDYVRIDAVVELNLKKGYLNIKLWDQESERVKKYKSFTIADIYKEIYALVKDIFSINCVNMEQDKQLLYRIYKDLTEKMIAPYKAKINKLLDADIEAFIENSFDKCSVSKTAYENEAVKRLHGLFERFLIADNFKEYFSNNNSKKGYVYKVSFSDQVGARVRATAPSEREIQNAEVFFDTRETIDNQRNLNSVWVKWFVRNSVPVSTKIEVKKEYIYINFKRLYLTKEIENSVLSNIGEIKK